MEAAESVFNASGRTKKAPGQKLADGIADLLFSLIIYVVFMLQASIAKNIPLEVCISPNLIAPTRNSNNQHFRA